MSSGSLAQEDVMAKIKHIALSTQDVDKTARFYIDVFGMKEIAKIDSPTARGYYLSDGDLNLAILNFKNDAVAGVERGKGFSGLHHIGFQVESLEEIAERLVAAGSEPRHDVNEALGVGPAPLEAARKLAPLIRSSADEIDAARELPRPLFEALADAGLFHLGVPRAIGGAELDLPTYVQVIEEIGKADASTGWAVNQGAIFATYAARMPRNIARAIWIETPRSVVANTPAATAKAVVVPGGYRVTGRQGFSTGCRHAAWVAAHAQIIE